jgi:hypothetical protein
LRVNGIRSSPPGQPAAEAGPAAAAAEKVRTRLLHEVDERRSTQLRASVNQLLDCYLEASSHPACLALAVTRCAAAAAADSAICH